MALSRGRDSEDEVAHLSVANFEPLAFRAQPLDPLVGERFDSHRFPPFSEPSFRRIELRGRTGGAKSAGLVQRHPTRSYMRRVRIPSPRSDLFRRRCWTTLDGVASCWAGKFSGWRFESSRAHQCFQSLSFSIQFPARPRGSKCPNSVGTRVPLCSLPILAQAPHALHPVRIDLVEFSDHGTRKVRSVRRA